MGKPDMIEKAKAHNEYVKTNFKSEIMHSAVNAGIYSPDSVFTKNEINFGKITLVDSDTVCALFEEETEGKVAVLNFASYKNPGGGYLHGATTQEEALCHKSFLFPVLSCFPEYYTWNRKNINKSLYLNRALYAPSIIFELNGKQKEADVITCAAPNFDSARVHYDMNRETNEEAFRDRIRFMLKVANHNHVDTLIAGAWGCGVFGQDPEFTARTILEENIIGGYVKNIIFAIPDSESRNYRAFDKVLGE